MSAAAIAASVALASALGFSFSTSLQHLSAGRLPARVRNPGHVLLSLLRHPLWLLGSLIGLTSWTLHAVALHFGTLALVQPIILMGVILAVFVRSSLGRTRPSHDEIIGVVITVVALIVVVLLADTDVSDTTMHTDRIIVTVVVAVIAAAVVATIANRIALPARSAGLMGMTAGSLFGVTACLMKVSGQAVTEHGLIGALGTWGPWTLIGMGLFALSLNQRAYQVSALADSMPILNLTSVLVSILLGVVLFGERLLTQPWALTIQILGLLAMGYGLRRIAEGTRPVAITLAG